jgi:hypothetical protein
VDHFNREEFFEAHDAWEDIWRQTKGPDRDFYQGLIQVTSAMHHMRTGNMRGARSLRDSALALLAPYGPRRLGIDLDGLRADFDRALAGILDVPVDQLAGRGQSGPVKIPYTHDLAFKINLVR